MLVLALSLVMAASLVTASMFAMHTEAQRARAKVEARRRVTH